MLLKMETERKFDEVLESLTDETFWKYVRSWLNEDFVLDIMNNWDTEIKKEAITEMLKFIETDETMKNDTKIMKDELDFLEDIFYIEDKETIIEKVWERKEAIKKQIEEKENGK